MVEVAGAERILQHGCDENGVCGVGTFSQWVLLRDVEGVVKMRVIVCAGLLPGSTAEEITAHVKDPWARGRKAVEALRELLGDRANELVPIRAGGIRLLRLEALMSDGCNTAKAVSRLLGEAKGDDGKEFYGEETWEAMDPDAKQFIMDICANHSRIYPVDEFKRQFVELVSALLSGAFDGNLGF